MRPFALSLCLLALASGCGSSRVARFEAPGEPGEPVIAGTIVADAKAAAEPLERNGFGIDRQVLDTEGKPVSDEEVVRLLDWKVAMPKRGRLAAIEARAFREFYYCGAFGSPDRSVEGSSWTARPAEHNDLDALKVDLLATGRFEAVTTVPSLFLPDRADLGRCRWAAARANSDLLLVYAKATRVVRFRNKLANFYPLIVGLVLPGEETVVVTRAEGALVDARTGRVFAVAQGGARGDDASSPLSATEEDRRLLMEKVERDALVDLARSLRADLESREPEADARRP